MIFEYVKEAEPVASEVIASKYELGVKSATIRNVLAELSDQGYLEQPHTSAGRIPSDLGYRYFVDRLVTFREPDSGEKQKVKGASDDGEALQEMLSETTRVLSRLTHLLSAATLVKNQNLTVRSAIVSAMGPKQALVVLVLSNGQVENRMVEVPVGLTLAELGQANELLHRQIVTKTLRAVAKSKSPSVPDNPATEKLLTVVWTAIRSVSRELNKVTVTTQGEEFLFGKPEFCRDAGFFASLLDDLKNSDILAEAMNAPGSGQAVMIGKENAHRQMHQLSVVRQSFYVGENEAGVIAVIGPTRMSYDESVPLVNFTASALSQALTKFLG